MKSARHQAILKLIEQYSIDRQEELLRHLRSIGFDVTQATVSRDIREPPAPTAEKPAIRPVDLKRFFASLW